MVESNEGEQLMPRTTGGRSDIILLYWDVEHGVKVLKKSEITQIRPLILDRDLVRQIDIHTTYNILASPRECMHDSRTCG